MTSIPEVALGWTDLEQLVSPERLQPYRAVASSEEAALHLYLWNARISSAFAELLGHLEVVLRNAIHDSLTALNNAQPNRGGRAWFDEPGWTRHHWLNSQAQKDRNRAITRARHVPGSSPRPGKVVSELNFGFWRYLLSARYQQSFWVPSIDGRLTVPGPNADTRRSTIEDSVEPLHGLRNRVAHHEPLIDDFRLKRSGGVVIRYSLDSLVTTVIEVGSWVSTEAEELLRAVDLVTPLLPERPR